MGFIIGINNVDVFNIRTCIHIRLTCLFPDACLFKYLLTMICVWLLIYANTRLLTTRNIEKHCPFLTTYVYMCVCVCVYLYIYIYIYIFIYLFILEWNGMYVCTYVNMHVCMYACMYVCMYACMYVSHDAQRPFPHIWNPGRKHIGRSA